MWYKFNTDKNIVWPFDLLPGIKVIGRFHLTDRKFSINYCSQNTHALHIYLYHARIKIGRREFTICPGDVTVTPAGISSCYDVPEPGYHYCAHFYADRITNDTSRVVNVPIFYKGSKDFALITAIFTQAIRFYDLAKAEARPEAEAAAASALRQILLHLAILEQDKVEPGYMDQRFKALEDMVEARLDNPPGVEEAARLLGVSQNYLARMFKSRYGMTISRFITCRRIEKAKYLLKHTDISIKQAGTMTGYNDPQHFNKQFRRLTGMSPTSYRTGYDR